jgi:transketolase
MILAGTVKGKGVSFCEGKDGWHGRAFKKGDEANRALAELEAQYVKTSDPAPVIPKPVSRPAEPPLPDFVAAMPAPAYALGDMVATREAYGTAIAKLGALDTRIVALDADVKNSTFSERFEKVFPDRFYENFIAEQVMVGASMGLASRGAIPFPSTFACFLERASDFIRMAGISNLNIKLCGSHAGISIGEDGPSQMALEDIAMMRGIPDASVFYPCEAVSAERLVALAAATRGPVYIRASRPKTPVIYSTDERFVAGGSKTLRKSDHDAVTVVGAGVTVFEALKAFDILAKDGIAIRVIDAYSIQPIDRDGLIAAGRATGGRMVTVEDHYAHGGLGDGVSEAVWSEAFRVQRLAVREIPRSGTPEELLDKFGISARAIVDAVRAMVGAGGAKS